ncbi:MAG: hypothetical protein AAGN35_21990 [Bacteroidota bacterium]
MNSPKSPDTLPISRFLKLLWLSVCIGAFLAGCSPYRAKKHPPKKANVSILNFKRSSCGCH